MDPNLFVEISKINISNQKFGLISRNLINTDNDIYKTDKKKVDIFALGMMLWQIVFDDIAILFKYDDNDKNEEIFDIFTLNLSRIRKIYDKIE